MFGSIGTESPTFLANRLLQHESPSTQGQQPNYGYNFLRAPSLGFLNANQGDDILEGSAQELANIQMLMNTVTGPNSNIPPEMRATLVETLRSLQQATQQQVQQAMKVHMEQTLKPLEIATQILSNSPPSLTSPSFGHA